MSIASPLALGSQLTIARGQVKRFDAKSLAPLVGVPYEIHSIRMCAYPSVNASVDCSLRGFVKFQFQAGRLPLTDHFVPMWNLCPQRQSIVELGGYFEWRFRTPLLLPAYGRIDAQVSLAASTPNAGVTPITVAVSYAGTLRGDLASLPNVIEVPFASAWDTVETGATLANDGMSLRNPLDRPVDVHSLVCRSLNPTTGLDGSDANQLQIMDPRGIYLSINGMAHTHTLFPRDTREFPYSGQLAPGAHFSARLQTAPSATYKPQISFLGSRRERL